MAGASVPRLRSWQVVALALLLLPLTSAQLPDDRLPVEEISAADIFRACEVPIESEAEDGVTAPPSLQGITFSGKWAYEQTSAGVLRNPNLLSDGGRIDLWIENDTAGSNLSLIHDVSAVYYVAGDAARNDALESTVAVRSRGHYVPRRGVLCLLGCQEALLPAVLPQTSPDARNFTGVGGVGDGDFLPDPQAPDDYENVEAGVANPTPISRQMETDCRTRIVLRFVQKPGSKPDAKAEVAGRMEALREPSAKGFFSPIIVTGSTGEVSNQILWYQLEMLVEALVCALQSVCVVYQILHSRKDPDGYYVSLTLISIQIFVYGMYWVRSLYYPIRYMNEKILWYFLSDIANVPRFVEFAIFALYVYLAIVVDVKRHKAAFPKPLSSAVEPPKQASEGDVEDASLLSSNARAFVPAGPGTSERQIAIFYWPIYIVIGVCMWMSFDFDAFLRMSNFLFLLPQICVNYYWDPPLSSKSGTLRALSLIYAVGITLLQMGWLTYEVLRPSIMGYDAYFEFPHAWYWSSMALMIIQLGIFMGQRKAGGRFTHPLFPASEPKDVELTAAPI